MKNFLFLLLLSAAFSCGSKKTTPESPYDTDSLEGKVWQLVTIAVDPEPLQVPADLPITVKFEAGKIEGHGGCNGYGGNYTLNGNKLGISGIIHTERYCEGASEWENRLLERLQAAKSYTVQGERMEINCGDMGNLVFRLNWKKRKGG